MSDREKRSATIGLAVGMMVVGIGILLLAPNVIVGAGFIAGGAMVLAASLRKRKNG